MAFIKQKEAIHSGSDYKGFVVVPSSYQIDFEAQGSISIVNKGQLHFLHKNRTPISFVSFLVNFLIDILGYEWCATYLLQLCDLMLNFLKFYDNFHKITSSFWRTRRHVRRLLLTTISYMVLIVLVIFLN